MKKITPVEKEKMQGCRLDLDSPRLPSARRSVSSADTNINRTDSIREASSSKLSMMVPFSWESSPGVRKDFRQSCDKELDPLPPKPPPCRWYPKNGQNAECYERDHSEGSSDYGDAFSDVFDSVSLTEQLGIAGRLSSFQGLGVKDMEEVRNQAPGFIMDRFLPAAKAIASSSVKKTKRRAQTVCRDPSMRETNNNNSSAQMGPPFVQNMEIQREMASRACGLMVFFPWKLKPIICGFNNPTNKIKTPRITKLSSFSPRRSQREARRDGELFHERVNYRENQAQRLDLGLPFIDTSRLTSAKSLNNLLQREERSEKLEGFNGGNESLPKLKPPSESWLSNTLVSTNKRS
ncbi:hypothetical protein LUZ60_010989 [Juncus effusus]|nr:hypothetical protein LUZ60_010989 [Juncus effusus]